MEAFASSATGVCFTVQKFEDRLASEYSALSARLKAAADYVVNHQVDVATRSLRTISTSSGIAPATYSRLARALGFSGYEELRELLRDAVERKVISFSDRAKRLQDDTQDTGSAVFLARHLSACAGNIEQLGRSVSTAQMSRAIAHLSAARRVIVLGSLSSAGIAQYMVYLAKFFAENWSMSGRAGQSLGNDLAGLGENDVLLIITKPPFARRTLVGAQVASERGAKVIVLTDTHTCPTLAKADVSFIVPSDSPHFFSSYAATIVLVESIIGTLVAEAGDDAQERISTVEALNAQIGETSNNEFKPNLNKGE